MFSRNSALFSIPIKISFVITISILLGVNYVSAALTSFNFGAVGDWDVAQILEKQSQT